MPENIQLEPMKLSFSREGSTWSKTVTVIETNHPVITQTELTLLPEMITQEYFDEWENQLKGNPMLNITAVERFI